MKIWKQLNRKLDGWVERRRRFQQRVDASPGLAGRKVPAAEGETRPTSVPEFRQDQVSSRDEGGGHRSGEGGALRAPERGLHRRPHTGEETMVSERPVKPMANRSARKIDAYYNH